MAQRKLNIKVTPDVDKSLVNLLNTLSRLKDKETVIKVKAVLSSKEVTAFFDKLDRFSKKTTTIKVKTNISSKELDNLHKKIKAVDKEDIDVDVNVRGKNEIAIVRKELSNFTKNPLYVDIKPRVRKDVTNSNIIDGSFVEKATSKLDKFNSKLKETTGKTHTVNFKPEGLAEIAQGLDNLSNKVMNVTGRVAKAMGGFIASESKELYDAQTSFVTQATELKMDDKQIQSAMKHLNDFGKTSKYSVAELNNLAIAMKGAGFDEDYGGFENLTTNLAALTALAPNSSTALQRVSRQIKQMSATSKVLNRDWNAIRDNVGGKVTQDIVKAFKARGIDDLPKAMAEGKILGGEFLEVLNEVGSSPALQKMARQSNTLASAWDNLKESLTVELVGTPYDEGVLSPMIKDLIKLMNTLQDATPIIAEFIGELAKDIHGTIFETLGNVNIQNFVGGLKAGLVPLRETFKLISKIVGLLTNKGENLGLVTGLLISFSALWLSGRKVVSVLSLIKKLSGVGSLFGGKASKGGVPSGNPLKSLDFQGLVNSLSSATKFLAIAGTIKLLASALKDINELDLDLGKVAVNLLTMAVVLGATAKYADMMSKALNKIGTVNLLKGLATIEGLALALVIISKTMEQLNKIDFKSSDISKKLAEMGLIITAFGIFSALVGKLTMSGVGLAIGLGALTLIALADGLRDFTKSMVGVAKAVKQYTSVKLPSSSKVAKQAENLANIIKELVKYQPKSGIISSYFKVWKNTAKQMEIDSLISLANKLKEFIKVTNTLPKEKDITDGVDKATKLMEALNTLSTEGESEGLDFVVFWDSISDAFTNMAQGLELSTFSSNIIKVSKFINELVKMDIPTNLDPMKNKILAIKALMDELTKVTTETKVDKSEGVKETTVTTTSNASWAGVINSFMQKLEVDNLIPAMRKLIGFIEELDTVDIPDNTKDITTKIGKLKEIMEALDRAFNGDSFIPIISTMIETWKTVTTLLKGVNITNSINVFSKIISLTESIIKLKITSKTVTSVDKKLGHIKSVMNKIAEFKVEKPPKFDKGTQSNLEAVKKLIGTVKETIDSLLSISEDSITAKIESVETALTQIAKLPNHAIFNKKDLFTKDLSTTMENIGTFTTHLTTMGTNLSSLLGIGDISGVGTIIDTILEQVKKLGSEEFIKVLDKFKSKTDYGAIGEEISKLVDNINKISKSLNTLEVPEVDEKGVALYAKTLDSIRDAIEYIYNGGDGAGDSKGNNIGIINKLEKLKGKLSAVEKATEVINSIKSIADSLSKLPDFMELNLTAKLSKFNEAITAIVGDGDESDAVGLMTRLAKLNGKEDLIKSVNDVITKVKSIATTLSGLPDVSDKVVDTITTINTAIQELAKLSVDEAYVTSLSNVLDKIKQIDRDLTALANYMETVGTAAGFNLSESFKTAVGDSLVNKIKEQKEAIENLDWKGAGSSISSKIKEGFDVSEITTKISAIQEAIDALKGKTVTIDIQEVTTKSTVRRENGGIIPEYHSTGGTIGRGWKQMGTDTVPAMLTAGEYVLKRSITSMLGREFLDNLNNLNLGSALKTLASKTGTQVINNTTNNITQNVDNKASFMNGLTELKGVIRA